MTNWIRGPEHATWHVSRQRSGSASSECGIPLDAEAIAWRHRDAPPGSVRCFECNDQVVVERRLRLRTRNPRADRAASRSLRIRLT